jgi:ADP-heptose:LPS heptosyltransferase
LHPTESDHAAVAAWCRRHHFDAESQCLVILNPHCRREANRWPASKFTELARRLLAYRQVRVALAGGRVARPLCDAVAAPLGEAIWRADGHFSLLGSASLFSRARVVVTGDTGPMHLAAAVETPVVAMFGPSDCLRTGPYASDAVVLSRSLSCTPCLGRCCRLNFVLPLCMDELDVDEVLTAVVARLDELDAGPMQRKSA